MKNIKNASHVERLVIYIHIYICTYIILQLLKFKPFKKFKNLKKINKNFKRRGFLDEWPLRL